MQPFRRKPDLVHAVRWQLGMQIPGVRIPGFFNTDTGRFQPEKYAVLDNHEGLVLVHPGDWVVRDSDGSLAVFDDAAFQERYEDAGDLLAKEKYDV